MTTYKDYEFDQLKLDDWTKIIQQEIGQDVLSRLNQTSIEGVSYPALQLDCDKQIELKSAPKMSRLLSVEEFESQGAISPVALWNDSLDSLEKIVLKNSNATEVRIATYLIHNAGASAVQELAIALSLAMQFPQSKISFEIAVGCEQYLNIAKIRALRYLWERFCSENEIANNFDITAVSSLREFTLYDHWNNNLRNTCSAAAALMGGVDNIVIYPHDELISRYNDRMRSENSIRLAENIYHILCEESHFEKIIDPAKGSYAVESLTSQLVEATYADLVLHEKDNYNIFWESLPQEIEQIADIRFKQLRNLSKIITGINSFTNPDEKLLSTDLELKFYESNKGKFPLRTVTQEFENLRVGFEKISLELQGVVLCYGDRKKLSARINFCKNIFEITGMKMEEVAFDAEDSNRKISQAQAVILCANDDDYEPLLKRSGDIAKVNSNIYIAGKHSPESLEGYPIRSAIYQRQDIFEVLKHLLEEMIL